jgi:uncharacterized metal-binding protein YceD (DUF177 family)
MAGGPPDLVDCERLAAERETLERVYELGQLPRLQDLLSDQRGRLKAIFGFGRAPSGRSAAVVRIEATPRLVCQRCLEGFGFAVAARSEVEFSADPQADGAASRDELFRSVQGLVSLRDLAEEELLLALPLVPACSAPQECGNAPRFGASTTAEPVAQEMVRPFAVLQDLIKKHDRT